MENIGVILPYIQGTKGFFERLFAKNKFDTLPVREYEINFIVVYDNQNCTRIFNRNNVENVILMTERSLEECDFNILDGKKMFVKLLPDVIRKISKSFDDACSVTVIDKSLSYEGKKIIEKLCSFCREVSVSTSENYECEIFCEKLMDNYGIAVNITEDEAASNSDIVVILEACGNDYADNCIIIGRTSKDRKVRIINDFHIPFKAKPPFGMSNLVFAECIDLINK